MTQLKVKNMCYILIGQKYLMEEIPWNKYGQT